MFSLEKMEGRSHGGLQLLTGNGGAALSSAFCDSRRARRNSIELCQEGQLGVRTGSASEGSGHGPELMEFKEHLGNVLTYRV